MGRRFTVLAVAAVLALVAASGAALADNVRGDAGNRLVGTDGKDNISGAGGGDNIFGKGGQDRLFGDAGSDAGSDVVQGGAQGDRIQGGTGQDDLFGQGGNDFVNAIDLQPNDRVDCGEGEFDIAGIDDFTIFDRSKRPTRSPRTARCCTSACPRGTAGPPARKCAATRARTCRPSTPARRPSRPRRTDS